MSRQAEQVGRASASTLASAKVGGKAGVGRAVGVEAGRNVQVADALCFLDQG